ACCTFPCHNRPQAPSIRHARKNSWFVPMELRMKSNRIALGALGFVLAFVLAASAAAQAWPAAKPVRVIAVFPPGGSVDQVARVLAQQMSTQTGQTFIVDNRGGASGSIGTAVVAKAEPDGYTIRVGLDTRAVHPSLIPSLPFDTLKDLT